MSRTHVAVIQRPDEADIELEVEFTVTSWGAPASWSSYGGDPPEPVEIELGTVTRCDGGAAFTLTSDEEARVSLEICEQLDADGPDDEPDFSTYDD